MPAPRWGKKPPGPSGKSVFRIFDRRPDSRFLAESYFGCYLARLHRARPVPITVRNPHSLLVGARASCSHHPSIHQSTSQSTPWLYLDKFRFLASICAAEYSLWSSELLLQPGCRSFSVSKTSMCKDVWRRMRPSGFSLRAVPRQSAAGSEVYIHNATCNPCDRSLFPVIVETRTI